MFVCVCVWQNSDRRGERGAFHLRGRNKGRRETKEKRRKKKKAENVWCDENNSLDDVELKVMSIISI